jgi:hypothetical protein
MIVVLPSAIITTRISPTPPQLISGNQIGSVQGVACFTAITFLAQPNVTSIITFSSPVLNAMVSRPVLI